MDTIFRFGQFYASVRRHVVLVLAFVLIGTCLSLAFALTRQPVYEASARAFVSVSAAANTGDLSSGSNFVQQSVGSYAELATTPYVLDPVIQTLSLDETASQLATEVAATASSGTQLLTVTARSTSAPKAAQIADAVTNSLESSVRDLAPDSEAANASVRLTQVQPASIPTTPIGTSPLAFASLSALAALVLALTVVYVLQRFDTRLRTEGQIQQFSHAPVLGRVPFHPEWSQSATIGTLSASDGEPFNTLRASLQFLGLPGSGQRIVVTSSIEGEGKSSNAIRMAVALAEGGKSVLLVDADLRRPSIGTKLGLEDSIGLTDVLIGATDLASACQRWGPETLRVIPTGRTAPNPSELIQSEQMSKTLEAMSGTFDVVIIDTPPLLPVSDAAVLAAQSDGALVVIGLRKVRTTEVSRALASLQQFQCRTLGFAVNMMPTRGPDSVGYYAPYGLDAVAQD